VKQAALNTFAALAVAALCAGAVFVGYDYLQDDNDGPQSGVEIDSPADTTVAPPPRDPAAQARAYSYLAEVGVSLPTVESVVRAALSDDPVNPDVYVRLRDNNPDPSGRVAPECAAVDEPFIVIDVVDFIVVDAIDLCTPEGLDLEARQELPLPHPGHDDEFLLDWGLEEERAVHDALAGLGVTLPMDEAEFIAAAENGGYNVRVAVRDGEDFLQTADYSATRLNVEVVDGQVVKVIDIG